MFSFNVQNLLVAQEEQNAESFTEAVSCSVYVNYVNQIPDT